MKARRRAIIALSLVLYALQVSLIWQWYTLAPQGPGTLDLAVFLIVTLAVGIVDVGVVRYLFAALKRAEEAYAQGVNERLRRSLDDYRVVAECEEDLAREVSSTVSEELTRAREALAQGRANDARGHLQQSLDIASQTKSAHTCSNVPVAAVLQSKSRQCEAAGASLETHVTLPEELGLLDVEVAAVFFNLIDNALHECKAMIASGGTVAPTISVSSMVQAGQLYVEVKNPCRMEARSALSIARRRNLLSEHGWGTDIVTQIAGDHGGVATFDAEGGVFIARVMIPLP